MNKKAFTFIELLVVISIIVITSVSGVFYFFKQISSMELASKIGKIKNVIDKLDSDINIKKNYDYKIFVQKNSLGFTGTINNLGLNYHQNLSMDFSSGTGIIYSNSGTKIKIYSGIKFQRVILIGDSKKYSFNFSKKEYGEVRAKYFGETLNTVFLEYFSDDNLGINNLDKLELTGINTKSDKTGTSYNSIIIKNINGKKSIIAGGSEIISIYLFFEKEGVEKFLEIKK